MKNVLTCVLALKSGSVVDYVLVKECDASSMVNKFRIVPFYLNSNYACTLQPKTHTLINVLEYKRKRDTLCNLAIIKMLIYVHMWLRIMSWTSLSLTKYVKTNREQLKDNILNIGHQYFNVYVGVHKILSFSSNAWFNE